MKTVVLASLIAAAAATGCTSDDPNTRWTIRTLDNPDIGCPPTYTTAARYSQPIDSAGNAVGSPVIDLFDCAAGEGTTSPLPPDVYQTWIEITNDNNTGSPYARSVPQILDLTAGDVPYDTEIYDDAGYFGFEWDLVGAQSGNPVTCGDAGIADPNVGGVELTATISGGTAAQTDQFNCTDHTGVTDPLPAGDYTISVDAFTDADGAIGDAVTVPTATIQDHNMVTDLGSLMIPIDGL